MHIRVLLTVPALYLASACAPVKGYPGPERPDAEISTIEVSYDSGSVGLGSAAIDGFDFGGAGVKVLPGQHLLDLEATVKDPPDHCYSYPRMNDYGYEKCLDKKGYSQCNCWDYLETHQKCYRQVHDNICRGELSTKAGKIYDLRISRVRDSGDVSVRERFSNSKVAEIRCNKTDQRTEENDEYVGTGRYTANSHGIYYCR